MARAIQSHTVCRPSPDSSTDEPFPQCRQATNQLCASISSPVKQGWHTSSNLREFLWNGDAYKKHCEHGCQAIISSFNVPKPEGDKWKPKLIWYHMLWAAFSKSLQKLAFIIFVGSSFSVYRNMCTHQNRPSYILIIWWRTIQDSYCFFLFLLPIFLASLAILSWSRKGDGMHINQSLYLFTVIPVMGTLSASTGMDKWECAICTHTGCKHLYALLESEVFT